MTPGNNKLNRYTNSNLGNGHVVSNAVEHLDQEGTIRVTVSTNTRQRGVTEDIKQGLAQRRRVAAVATHVLGAFDALQGYREGSDLDGMQAKRLEAFGGEFGAEGLVVVEGINHKKGYQTGNPDVIHLLAEFIEDAEAPAVCLIGTGQAPVYDQARLREMTVGQAILSEPAGQFVLSNSGIMLPEDCRAAILRESMTAAYVPAGYIRL